MKNLASNPIVLLKKYKDVVGRIVTVFRNKETKQYTIESKLYDRNCLPVMFFSLSFSSREACKEELKRFPRETRSHLAKSAFTA